MNIAALVTEFMGPRAPGWLVLDTPEITDCALSAARFYAAYGDIKSLSLSDTLPGAPAPTGGTGGPGDIGYFAPLPTISDPVVSPSLPVKSLSYITGATVLSVGEWALIRPLFVLYTERENAMRLEASRALGLEVYGRMVSEISGDIERMEAPEGLPARAFCYAVVEVA